MTTQYPIKPTTYHTYIRRMRRLLGKLEARAEAEAPRERAARTQLLHIISNCAADFSQRNRWAAEQYARYITNAPAPEDDIEFARRRLG